MAALSELWALPSCLSLIHKRHRVPDKKKKKPKPKTGLVPSGPQTAKLLFTPKSEATEVRLKLTLLITAKGTRMRLPPSPPAKGYIKNNKNKKALPPAPAPLWKDRSRL